MAGYKRHRGGDAWQLIVTIGTDYTGKPKRYTKTFHGTEKQADKELSRFYVECESGNYNSTKPVTVQALADVYMSESVNRTQKRNSRKSAESIMRNWILPYFGKRKVTSVTHFDVLQWVNMIEDQGKSAKTVHNIFSVFKGMFDFAQRIMRIITDNPCTDIVLPKVIKKESNSYQEEDALKILQILDNVPADDQALKCFMLLAIFGGFRKGEILGFDWQDLDLNHNTISVFRTRYRDSTEHEVFEDTPKTDRSLRTVTLPATVIKELKKLQTLQKKSKLQHGQYYVTDDYPDAIMKKSNGELLNPDKPYKWFGKLCKDNGLQFTGVHTLRHTNASLLVDMGANYVDVSKRLGHAQLSTTLNIYTHLFKNKDEQRADQLDQFAQKAIK